MNGHGLEHKSIRDNDETPQHGEHAQFRIVARVTLGALPSLCMLLMLGAIIAFLFASYRLQKELCEHQTRAVDGAIVEGREFHHAERRMLRKIAERLNVPDHSIEVNKSAIPSE